MIFLPSDTILGELEILEVYVKFNGARLLSCENKVGQTFLGLWVEEEEDFDLWLYALVSVDRLKSIRCGKIDLHNAFLEPENNILYKIEYTHINNSLIFSSVTPGALDKDWLPLKNTYINNFVSQEFPLENSRKSTQNAITKIREVVNIKLNIPSIYPQEASALRLGNILSSFQLLLNYIERPINISSTTINSEINKQTEFSVFATAPGSFEVELGSLLFEPNAFGNSTAGDAVEKFLNLIKIGNNSGQLQEYMNLIPSKTAGKYRSFLESIVNSGSNFTIEWGSPTLNRGGFASMTFESAKETLAIVKRIESIKPKEYEVIGVLFKIDIINWKFGIEDISKRAKYTGDVLEEAKSRSREVTSSHIYKVKIRETGEILSVNNETKPHYQLISIEPYQEEETQLSLIKNMNDEL